MTPPDFQAEALAAYNRWRNTRLDAPVVPPTWEAMPDSTRRLWVQWRERMFRDAMAGPGSRFMPSLAETLEYFPESPFRAP